MRGWRWGEGRMVGCGQGGLVSIPVQSEPVYSIVDSKTFAQRCRVPLHTHLALTPGSWVRLGPLRRVTGDSRQGPTVCRDGGDACPGGLGRGVGHGGVTM